MGKVRKHIRNLHDGTEDGERIFDAIVEEGRVNRKQIPLGYYDKLEDAIDARKVGEEKYFRSKQEKVDAIKRGTSK